MRFLFYYVTFMMIFLGALMLYAILLETDSYFNGEYDCLNMSKQPIIYHCFSDKGYCYLFANGKIACERK